MLSTVSGLLSSSFVEIDNRRDIVWEAYAAGFQAIRLERLPLYTGAANDLGIGEPVRFFYGLAS